MRKEDLFQNLPWLPLGPTEEVLGKVEQHIITNRGDFYSIYGPSGCGKTRFMAELSQRLDNHEHVVARCIVAGRAPILQQVAQMLDTTEDETAITQRLQEIPPTGIKMVLLVDDAEKLTQEELAFLYRTKEKINSSGRYRQAHLVIALFMDLNTQDIFSKEVLMHSNSFTIGPINHMQVSELVTHIYQHFGKEPQYSLSDLRKLHAFSYGYPGRIVRLISADLEPRFEFKKRHAVYGLLMAALVGGLIYFGLQYEKYLDYFDLEVKAQDPISEIFISSQVTPVYYPALNQLIEQAEANYQSIPKGIVIMQGRPSVNTITDEGKGEMPNKIELESESDSSAE